MLLAVVLGVALGVASFSADLAGGATGVILQFVASTGFAWGCLAFAAAAPVRSRPRAVAAPVALLCSATWCYYGLNLATGRWRAYGLEPVLTAAAYWTVLSVAGGAALGALAHVVRTARAPWAAAAAGLVCGLLSGAGIDIVLTLLAVGDHGRQRLLEGLLQAVLGAAVATWAFGRRPGPRSWPRYAAAAAVACTVAAAAWGAVESVPVAGF
ncbi:hypothetical protein [Dactylosporangium darangshiense]|uniref:Integral membrane protein n=1 Tax=Dactylosporangium darangshiense TaxID=579108 RepID=A0ABP8D8F5_9ACTN